MDKDDTYNPGAKKLLRKHKKVIKAIGVRANRRKSKMDVENYVEPKNYEAETKDYNGFDLSPNFKKKPIDSRKNRKF